MQDFEGVASNLAGMQGKAQTVEDRTVALLREQPRTQAASLACLIAHRIRRLRDGEQDWDAALELLELEERLGGPGLAAPTLKAVLRIVERHIDATWPTLPGLPVEGRIEDVPRLATAALPAMAGMADTRLLHLVRSAGCDLDREVLLVLGDTGWARRQLPVTLAMILASCDHLAPVRGQGRVRSPAAWLEEDVAEDPAAELRRDADLLAVICRATHEPLTSAALRIIGQLARRITAGVWLLQHG